MKLQRMLSNGNWIEVNESDVDELIECAVNKKQRTPPTQPKTPWGIAQFTQQQVLEALEIGRELKTGTDWYDLIRLEPAPRQLPVIETVLCDCGHRCPKSAVLSASTGTSCPDCYDDRSN